MASVFEIRKSMDNDDDDDRGQILVGNGGNPDDDAQEEEELFYQKACFLASLVLRIGKACGIEALRKNCRLFPVTSLEVAALCELPKSPLRLSISSKDAAAAASATLVDVSPSFLLQLQGSLRRLRTHKEVQVSPAGHHHHHHHHQHGAHGCGAGTAAAAAASSPPPPPLLVQNLPLLPGAAAAALQGSDNNNKQVGGGAFFFLLLLKFSTASKQSSFLPFSSLLLCSLASRN